MDVKPGELHTVSWRDCCPWLILTRTIGLSIGLQVLLIAVTGTLVNTAGWRLASTWFLEDEDVQRDTSLLEDVEYFGRWPSAWLIRNDKRVQQASPVTADDTLDGQAERESVGLGLAGDHAWGLLDSPPPEPISMVAYRFVHPLRRLFDSATTWRPFAYYLFGATWTVVVWALFGSIITRIAAVYLAREERIGLREAWRHALTTWGSHVAAPLLPLLGVVLLALPMVALGLCMRLDLGLLLAGVLWLPVLFGAFLMMVLLLGLMFGWPLMWGTIAAESSDAFDAISRTYAYTFQRPFRYLSYVIVAAIFGTVGWLLVWGVSESTVHLAYWGTGWGAGSERIVAVQDDANFLLLEAKPGATEIERRAASGQDGMMWRGGVILIGLGVALIRAMASAFAYSYFWCVAAAIYLLLRSDVDNTEMDDIHLDDEGPSYGLPSLTKDAAGVPGVDEPSVDPPPTSADESAAGKS